MVRELKERYGGQFEDALIEEIARVGTYKEVPAGFKFLDIGDYIRSIPLLLSGAIKILREDDEGDELLLYYLEPGDTCSMTLTCCMGDARSEIRAVAETNARLIMVPVQKMDEWTAKYRTWRNFVFESYQNRLNELFLALDGIAFRNMDERLVQYLKEKARVTGAMTLHNTHQEIAYDLHTSRVVVSRLLKKLEEMGRITLHRNNIEIIDL